MMSRRWIVLASSVILQIILGGIYAWSVFIPVLTETTDLHKTQCGMIFGITIAIFSITMIPAGKFLNKYGTMRTALIGSLLYTTGYILSSFSNGDFIMLIISFGVIIGAGIGFGYVCPLTACMKWFPDHKGFVTGIAVAGFGGGAILLSNFAEFLIYTKGLSVFETFRFTGFIFGSAAILSSFFIVEPESEKNSKTSISEKTSLTDSLKTKPFILITTGMFAGTLAGLMIVSNLKPLMLENGLDEFNATLAISLFAMGNITGRLLWGKISDRTDSRKTILSLLIFYALSIATLWITTPSSILLISTFINGLAFGGCFVVFASAIVKNFGVKAFASLYPICFLGYGLSALIGPALGGYIYDSIGSYSPALMVSLAVILISISIIFAGYRESSEEI